MLFPFVERVFAVRPFIIALLSIVWCGSVRAPLAVLASEAVCGHCGCDRGCVRVCRLVRETKEIEVTFWACCDEDVCVPGPACRGRERSVAIEVQGPQDGDCNCIGCLCQRLSWHRWSPGKATIKSRKKLYKKTVTREIPTYRWVVEDICPACESRLAAVTVDRKATIPPPPAGVRVAAVSRRPPETPSRPVENR